VSDHSGWAHLGRFCSVLLLSSARFEAEPSRRQGQHRRARSVPCLSHGRPELYLLRVVFMSEFVFSALRREREGCRLSVPTGLPPVCSCCPLVSRPTRDRGWFSALLATLGLVTWHRPDYCAVVLNRHSIRRRLRAPCRKCLIVQSHRPTFIHAQNV